MPHNVTPSLSLKYRPAIDGLRSLAILSVFFFHLNRKWLPGGFVGVDVFFVISGYLITSLLLKDRARGSLSLATFYQRRIARIFPVFFLVGFSTLLAAAAVYSPQDLASAGATFVSAALSVANLKFMLQGDYFTLSPDAQPFLHYWSLSVEEQFYLLFPLLLVLTMKWRRERLLRVAWSGWALSLLACILVTYARPVWAFYLLPTRAWELLTGAILALAPTRTQDQSNHWSATFVPIVGLAAIGLSFIIVPENHTFPGAWALLPVLGTAAVIRPGNGANPVERVLALAPLVLIGQMSYSLYLWHWPVFSLVDYRLYQESDVLRLGLKVAITLPLSYLSFRYVEGPARHALSAPGQFRAAVAFLAVALLLSVPAGIWVRKTNYIDASPQIIAGGGLVFEGRERGPSVVLMGDSTGSMYARMLKELCDEIPCKLTVISVSAGDPLPHSNGQPSSLWLDSLAVVRREHPDVLLLACAWDDKLKRDPDRLTLAARELVPLAGRVVLLSQPPILPADANRAGFRAGRSGPYYEEQTARTRRNGAVRRLREVELDGVTVLEIGPLLELPDGSVRFFDDEKREIYQDSGHLSDYGARLVRPSLRSIISGTLAGSARG